MATTAADAFGLDLRAEFPLDGLRPGRSAGARSQFTRVALTDAGAPDPWERSSEAVTLGEWRGEGGSWTLEHDARLGYRLSTQLYGNFVVSPDGRSIECAPPPGSGRGWQHCLRGQVLPLAALLRGFETFHASAVALDHRAVAFVGGSRAGKSSIAVNLVLRGATLLTDDVLALEARGGRPFAYPGTGIVSLRHSELEALRGRRESLDGSTVLESDGEASRAVIARYAGAAPLAALYFLDRDADGATRFEPIDPPDVRLLLAATFNFVVRSRRRLLNQLDLCSCLAARVPQFWLRIGPEDDAAGVARAVEAHAGGLANGAGPR